MGVGAGTSPSEPEFFCGNPDDLSATSQRPIFTKFGHVPSINAERLCFSRQKIEFLGHLVAAHGVNPMQDKLQAIRDWPTLLNHNNHKF